MPSPFLTQLIPKFSPPVTSIALIFVFPLAKNLRVLPVVLKSGIRVLNFIPSLISVPNALDNPIRN